VVFTGSNQDKHQLAERKSSIEQLLIQMNTSAFGTSSVEDGNAAALVAECTEPKQLEIRDRKIASERQSATQ
jgi:hypothetical protein